MTNKHAAILGRRGGKATLAKHGREKMTEWGKLGGRPKKVKEELEECPMCNQMKSDVGERPNHYAQDVYNEEGATMVCCSECEEQNLLDI